jgi:hypothetical protein
VKESTTRNEATKLEPKFIIEKLIQMLSYQNASESVENEKNWSYLSVFCGRVNN